MNTKEHFHAIARSTIRFVKAAVIGAFMIIALNSYGYIIQFGFAPTIEVQSDADMNSPIIKPKGK